MIKIQRGQLVDYSFTDNLTPNGYDIVLMINTSSIYRTYECIFFEFKNKEYDIARGRLSANPKFYLKGFFI